MKPIEKPAIIDTLARETSGKQILLGKISLYYLMDKGSLEKIATNTGQRLWGAFVTFGSVSAKIIAFFMIFFLIKCIADTVIHG